MKRLIKRFNFSRFSKFVQKGSGNIYVIAILGTVVAGSALMVGGLVPQLDPPSPDAQVVEIDTELDPSSENNALELRSFGIIEETPTPPPLTCDTAAISILVDTSTSMVNPDSSSGVPRIENLKTALRSFVGNFSDETVVSLTSFNNAPKELVSFDKYQNNRQALNTSINNLIPAGDTEMLDAFRFVKGKIQTAKIQYPDRRFFLVFMSDGYPETGDCKLRKADGKYYQPNGQVCTVVVNGKTVDATIANHKKNPVSVAKEIKDMGVKNFAISILGDSDFLTKTKAEIRQLMRGVASPPYATYFINSPNSSDLEAAYQAVQQRICPEQPVTPTP